jgi:hypothetical protein
MKKLIFLRKICNILALYFTDEDNLSENVQISYHFRTEPALHTLLQCFSTIAAQVFINFLVQTLQFQTMNISIINGRRS